MGSKEKSKKEAKIQEIRQERKNLLEQHEEILEKIKNQKINSTSTTAALTNKFDGLEQLVDVQQKKIEALLGLEKDNDDLRQQLAGPPDER